MILVQYVPWLLVGSNVHTEQEQEECQNDLLLCVCKRYKGTSPACSKFQGESDFTPGHTPNVSWNNQNGDVGALRGTKTFYLFFLNRKNY